MKTSTRTRLLSVNQLTVITYFFMEPFPMPRSEKEKDTYPPAFFTLRELNAFTNVHFDLKQKNPPKNQRKASRLTADKVSQGGVKVV